MSFGAELGAVFRREAPMVTAALVRMSGDLAAAEDAVQDAFTIAARQWPSDGFPANPGGWIMTTARRRLLDRLRRHATGELKERAAQDLADVPATEVDDRLALLFTCCHPALNLESRVALTLRTICGLSTEEIAAAFVAPTATMAKRITRAKNKITQARIAYEVPDPEQWAPRLSAVLATNYLAFNRGYDLGPHDRRGIELCGRAIELARLLDLLIPREPEIEGLLALMLLTHARQGARVDGHGELVLFADQDRRVWDRRLIGEALALVAAAPTHGSVGQYWIQAAIAAEHIGPARPEDRRWPTIVALYDQLLVQTRSSPVVQLNRALAVAEVEVEVDGPDAALALIAGLDGSLDDYASLPAARADLHRRAGRLTAAADEYRRAVALAEPGPRRESLVRALHHIESVVAGPHQAT